MLSRNTYGEFEKASGDDYQELVAQVKSLSQQLVKLRADREESRTNRRGASWRCGKPRHFRRNCPQRCAAKGKTTERSAEFTSAVACTLTVQGVVEGRITPMLVDTGSSITLLHEKVWKEAVQGRRKLQPSTGPVMAQECLLGTDFLEKGNCVIDVKNKLLNNCRLY